MSSNASESNAAISTVSLNKVSTTDLADVPQADIDYAAPASAPTSSEKKSDLDDGHLGDTLSIASGHGTVKFNRNTVYHDAMSMSEEDMEAADGVLEGDSHVRGSDMGRTITNWVNTIIGSGVLALPSCAAKTGWLLAVLLMVISAGITWVGLHFLGACVHRVGGDKTSFGAVAARSYPWLMIIVDLASFLVTFGVTVAYMTVASNVLPACVRQFATNLEDDAAIVQPWLWLILCWTLVAMPLSMLKQVKFLAYTSALALLCIVYTTVIVVTYASGILDPCEGKLEGECVGDIAAVTSNVGGILNSIPVFFTAFCCAPSMFNLYNDFKKPSVKRLDIAAGSTMGICTAFYTIIALAGYFTYGSNVTGNILDSFPVAVPATIARIGTAFVVTVSYPLLMHPARDAIVHVINVITKGKFNEGKPATIIFYAVAAFLNVLSALLAFVGMPLDLILSITGSIGVVNLSLTIPFLFYFKMFEDKKDWKRTACIPGAVLGVTASIVCAYYSLAPLF